MPTKPQTKPGKNGKTEAEVKYPEPKAMIFRGGHSFTVQMAKDMLGWVEETEQIKFGSEYTLRDENDNLVRCVNNTGNRPLHMPHVRELAQEILNLRWRFNMESIIIGRSGRVLSGQHRLIALVLASQIWAGEQKKHWKTKWKTEPTIEVLIATGAPEDPETVRTLDNVRARTLSDVLFTDPDMFGKASSEDRIKLCKMLSFAVEGLWDRTGAKKNAFVSKKTHSEALDFIDRHPSIKIAVKHLFDEDKDGQLSKIINTKKATALMYLMGVSASDGDEYRKARAEGVRHLEKKLDMKNWDKAEQFWQDLGNPAIENLSAVRKVLGNLNDPEAGGTGSWAEKAIVLIKAWPLYLSGEEISEADIKPDYRKNEDGFTVLDEAKIPALEGIDYVEVEELEEKDEDELIDEEEDETEEEETESEETEEQEEQEAEQTPEEVAAEKERVRKERLEKLKAAAKAKKKLAAPADSASATSSRPSIMDFPG